MSRYRWIRHNGEQIHIGIRSDGSLYNPSGYPENLIRDFFRADAAKRAAERHQRRSEGAKQGAVTRASRQQKRVWEIARRCVAAQATGPRDHCYVCGRSLTDPDSIERGIGSECWQDVLSAVDAIRSKQSGVSYAERAIAPTCLEAKR